MRLIRAHDPDLIVSTYPGVTAVLGELRRKGRLDVPCYSSITDLAGLQLLGPSRDRPALHHPSRVDRGGRADRRAGQRPLGQAADLAGVPRPRARGPTRAAPSACPATGKVIAVSGGGWGVGDLLGATRAALAVPDATVLCLCGRNDKLRAEVVERVRRRAPAADHGLHRPHGRRARRRRRAGPLQRRAHRARGDHPRLPGRSPTASATATCAPPTPRSSASGSPRWRRNEAELGAGARPRARATGPSPTLVRPPALHGVADPQRRAPRPPAAGVAGAHRPRGHEHRRGGGVAGWTLTTGASYSARLALRPHAPVDRRRHRHARGGRARRRAARREVPEARATRSSA